jgi:hypothetical protein
LQQQGFAGLSEVTKGGFNPTTFSSGTFDASAANKYMNPYLQASLNPQLDEARRQSQITQQGNAAKMTQAGAFGGSRQAILDAENQRNLGTNLAGITGQGYNTAYGNAMSQFNADQARKMQEAQFGAQQGMNAAQLGAQDGLAGQQAGEASRQFGANYGLQNRQAALAAAGQLGALGQQQYAQRMGINAAQQQAGAQIQAQEQQGLSNAYQEFLNKQNYPYKQIGFMNDVLRGTPTSGGSQSMYQQPSNSANALAGVLGAGYAGSRLLPSAKGGTVKGYARGGMIDSIGFGLGAYALGRT